MAAFRTHILIRNILLTSPSLILRSLRPVMIQPLTPLHTIRLASRNIGAGRIRCMASDSGAGGKKMSSRLSQMAQLLQEAEDRAFSAGNDPIPKITLDHVTVSFARSGGPGGQNVNKVNTKVDMRFNVNNAYWLSDRVRERILQMEKNRINKEGEIVISSTKTRTQKGNIEDALEKLQCCYWGAKEAAEQESYITEEGV
ncbi:class I peptide chain release factor isoform X2 [Tasmannia lanceolata]|uniref:class I peptide chain release factor isoform X2 n=1 Tax=Tasmannia lanceolata TaxID=3420 RepID=UPI0040631636